ncbi:symplekin domain-containing protein [Plasmodium brasilianum]|uniref:Symplekin domain-containing protein n=1 Tax=Plasmodium brasilianum TaxID=5824 RepID=A0ACB9Y2K0_PLABR|nr:symplekin domain-containing protein [Plasmodium brasilianum]
MLKSKKSRIQKIIQVLENNEEDEKTLIMHINEIEQIFFECFNNENKKNSRIIHIYVIPYVNLLLERVHSHDGKNNTISFKERLITRILTFCCSILRINKSYSYLVISYFVNLFEEKYYIVKIIEYLKKIIIYLLKGLLFSKICLCAKDDDDDDDNYRNNNLNNIKQGFHNYVILKSKVFNVLMNFHFYKWITDNPYKYDLIKNLMLILTKEILFFFHVLKNKKNIFKEILREDKQIHHVINEIFDISYLNDVTDKVDLKNYDEIILIWLEQNIRLLNDLILFNLSNNANNIFHHAKDENFMNENKEDGNWSNDNSSSAKIKKAIASTFAKPRTTIKKDIIKKSKNNKIEEEQNIKKEHVTKQDKVDEEVKNEEVNNTNNDRTKYEIFNKLIYHFNSKHEFQNITNENVVITANRNDLLTGEKIVQERKYNQAEHFMDNYMNYYTNDTHYRNCMNYVNFFDNSFFDNTHNVGQQDDASQNASKYLQNLGCLINNIDQITTDNIIFLTHLMRNIFYLIREVPFVLNFFLENIFIMIEKLMHLKGNIKKWLRYHGDRNCNIHVEDNLNMSDSLDEDIEKRKGRGSNSFDKGNNNYKEKLLHCMFYYIKNELYILICRKNVNFSFYYSYITSLLNFMGEEGTTDELTKKKIQSLNNALSGKKKEQEIDIDIEEEEEEEEKKKRKKKTNENNFNCEHMNKTILRKEDYGYKKLKNEQVDIMSYLKVKMNESENENQDFKKEEKENIFINQIIKKLYLTNFKLDKEFYENFDCSRKSNLIDFIQKKKRKKKNTDIVGANTGDSNICGSPYGYDFNSNSYEQAVMKIAEGGMDLMHNSNHIVTSYQNNSNMESGVVGLNKNKPILRENFKEINDDSIVYEKRGDNKDYKISDSQWEEEMIYSTDMQNNMIEQMNYKSMYSKFLNNDLKYYDNVKSNELILGTVDLYFFLIFSQILNNNLENSVQVLGENVFIKKINNLKIINNIIKRIIINSMMKERLKFFFLTLYSIKINSICVFTGDTRNDIFLNYSTVFKIFNNLLFYAYIDEKKKKKKKAKKRKRLNQLKRLEANTSCAHLYYGNNYDNDILGYTTVCYNYFYKLKKKLKKKDCVYRYELQKRSFKIKCKYDEILNLLIFFLHSDKLLANHRDQYIKTFIEQILEAPKLSFSFFIYLIIWLNNIDIHIDYKGYINSTHNDNMSFLKNEEKRKEIIDERKNKGKFLKNKEGKIEHSSFLHFVEKESQEDMIKKRYTDEFSSNQKREKTSRHKELEEEEQCSEYNIAIKEKSIYGNSCSTLEKKKRINNEHVTGEEVTDHNNNMYLMSSPNVNYHDIQKYSDKDGENKYIYDSLTYNESSDASFSHFEIELSEEEDEEEEYNNGCMNKETNREVAYDDSPQKKGSNNCHNETMEMLNFNYNDNNTAYVDNSLKMPRKISNSNTYHMNEEINNEANLYKYSAASANISVGVSQSENRNTDFKYNDKEAISTASNEDDEDNTIKVRCKKESEMEEELFNINYYIKYTTMTQNSSNYYIFSFSLISNLLKKNQNIKAKKTILCIYINTLFKSSNEIRALLKKLITASKGIYNNTVNFFTYTKRIYSFYHKVFILFLLYICSMYIPNLKNDILFFSPFAFYLWPIELINFVHNFLLTNFSFFYNDILSIFVNYEQITFYEKRMLSLKNYAAINEKLNEYIKGFHQPNIFQSVEAFLKETDFFNNSSSFGKINDKENEQAIKGNRMNKSNTKSHMKTTNEEDRNGGRRSEEEEVKERHREEEESEKKHSEEKECLQRNEISQKILLEEIFVVLFIKTTDLMEEKKLLEKMKKSNRFLNFISIDFVDELCKFVLFNIEKGYEKNKDHFWLHFNLLFNETSEDDKTKIMDKFKYIELQDILNFFINSVDNFLSICVRSSIFFHLYLFVYSNCLKKEVRTILLNKFIETLPLLKSLFHEEFFRILKYNNKLNDTSIENTKRHEERENEKGVDEKENQKDDQVQRNDTNDSNTNTAEHSTTEQTKTEQTQDPTGGKEQALVKEEVGSTENEEQKNKELSTKETNTVNENSAFQVNIEIIKYISKNLYDCPSHPVRESHFNFLNFCYNLYLENQNIHFIIELIGFLKKDQILHIFSEIIKNEMEENIKIEILKCCINNIIQLPYSYILEKQNEKENESYYITNIEIFYFYYNLNKNKNIQKIMLDYFVTKVNLNTVDNQENIKMYNDITVKDIANIIQQIAENSNPIFPIYGRFLCQITKNINILREFISSIIMPLLIQKKIWTNKFIWKGFLMCISMLWSDFKHSLFYVFFMLPKDECLMLFNALQQKHSIQSDLMELISLNEQAKRMCPDYLKNLLNA